MKVVGIVNVDFPDKQDPTKRVKGLTVYALKPMNFEGGIGCKPEKVFLSEWYIQNRLHGEVPDLNDDMEVVYNSKGKIEGCYITKPVK